MHPYNETTTNPFLCDDCQQLRYCRKTREAICYYFMKLYEEASSVAAGINHYAFNRILPEFLDACERAVNEAPIIDRIFFAKKYEK